MNLNIGSSVFKREAKDADKVRRHLERNGWELTGSMGSRVFYYENSGVNLTVVDGAMGTVILPSGPLRGAIFGKNMELFSDRSVVGAGANTNGGTESGRPEDSRRSENTYQ